MKAVRERTEQLPAEPAPAPPRLRSFLGRMFEPVDISSLVVFRIAFGALMLWDVLRYIAHGWVELYFIEPAFHFTYYGFDWVTPLPGAGMHVLFAVLGITAVLTMLGLWYRLATIVFFVGFTYMFLLEQTRYLNHFYLIILFAFLMIFVPAHRAFSIDSRARPELRSSTAPAWSVWILRFQIGIVYFFGGLAKINVDWLRGEPLRHWLANATDFPLIGRFFTEEWLVYSFAYGSLLLDLLAFPLLLWRRTRVPTFVLLVIFHLMNAIWLHIGVFPWLGIAATSIFFSPDWPRRLVERYRSRWPKKTKAARKRPDRRGAVEAPPRSRVPRKVAVGLLGAYVAVQIFMPLRHFLYPGEVSWTEEGHHFAWHMMLRDKMGGARFFVTRPDTQETFEVDPADHVTFWQHHSMATRPYLTLQFAHYLADTFSPPQGPRVEVRAYAIVSMNFREPQFLIDPRVDLAKEEVGLGAADWIVPLGSELNLPPPEV